MSGSSPPQDFHSAWIAEHHTLFLQRRSSERNQNNIQNLVSFKSKTFMVTLKCILLNCYNKYQIERSFTWIRQDTSSFRPRTWEILGLMTAAACSSAQCCVTITQPVEDETQVWWSPAPNVRFSCDQSCMIISLVRPQSIYRFRIDRSFRYYCSTRCYGWEQK